MIPNHALSQRVAIAKNRYRKGPLSQKYATSYTGAKACSNRKKLRNMKQNSITPQTKRVAN